MGLIRSTDTKPELFVRRLVHSMGYRYRLHRRDLPGVPDLVFRPKQKVIFVHGCFWHGHKCRLGRMPKSRLDYWEGKISKNKKRDAANLRKLHSMNWKYIVLWECQLHDRNAIAHRIKCFLDGENEIRNNKA